MAKRTEILNWNFVKTVKRAGHYHDGRGLYLRVTATGGKSWAYRYWTNGRLREFGLGNADWFPNLEVVRAEHLEVWLKFKKHGIDPIEAKKASKLAARVEAVKAMTFQQCAEGYLAAHSAGWRSAKHAAQWPQTLETYAYPVFGKLPVAAVDVGLVMRVLEPIWAAKRETASRVRGRIESVLDWATVRGFRQGENPARWRGHLESLLAGRSRVAKANLAAMPYAELPAFMRSLRDNDSVAARALEFCILCASRTGEVLGAKWSEIDGDVWTIPAERMKAGNEHRVPLSEAALAALGPPCGSPALSLFPALPEPAMRAALRSVRAGVTVHGFRSTFSTWAADHTGFSKEIREAALAHKFGGDEVYRSYQRSDLLERRRELMELWSQYCAGNNDRVIQFPRAAAGVGGGGSL